jgi:hypothetical protein
MSKLYSLAILMAGICISGCSSDKPAFPAPRAASTPPATTPAPNVSGTWYLRNENNAVNCGLGEYIDAQTIMITQDARVLSLLTSAGTTLPGIVRGDIIEWTGVVDERGGTTTFTAAGLMTSAGIASGNAAWTWTDGVDSCNGMMAITAAQNWSLEETLTNSRPNIADVLPITNGVAFAYGIATTVADKDYFALDLASDATVQIELSHFDLTTSNLDLQLMNESLETIATSQSTDSFEKIEIDLSAGRYYIGMLPIATPGDELYYVSVDLN